MWVTLHWTKWRLTKGKTKKDFGRFAEDNGLEGKPVLALLAGSRKQEIKDNLPMMVEAASVYEGQYELVLAAAPNIDPEFYGKCYGAAV